MIRHDSAKRDVSVPSNGAFCKNMAIMIMSMGNQLSVRVAEDTVVLTYILCCQLQRHSREMRWCANQLALAHPVLPYYFVAGKTNKQTRKDLHI